MTGAIAMSTNKITGVGDPTSAQDVATKVYTDTQRDTRVAKTGDSMSGALAMGSNKITGLGTPTAGTDATTKTYVDGILGSATVAATSASNAATSESNAATSETNASNSATAAASSASSAAASLDSFDDRYLGAKSSAPTVDNDGDALIVGALYFDSTAGAMKVYSANGWTNAGSSVNGTTNRYSYTATAGQTVFAATYDSGYVDIFLNGVKQLVGTDVTATSGTSVVFASGTTVNDIVEIVGYGTFVLADHLTQTQSDARYVNLSGDTMTGNLSLGDNDKAIFGAGSDLQIYHDGNNSIINEQGDGDLLIYANNLGLLSSNNSEYFLQAATNGAVSIRYDNSIKLATSSTGITVGSGVGTEEIRVDAGAGWADLTLNSNSTNGGHIYFNDGSNAGEIFYYHPSDYMAFNTSGTEALRIGSDGTVLVGRTAEGDSNVGHTFRQDGFSQTTRSGGLVADFNRLSSHGDICRFQKDGASVGGISTWNDHIGLFQGGTRLEIDDGNDCIFFTNNSVGGARDGTTSIGKSNARIKDLHLSGKIQLGGTGAENVYVEGTNPRLYVKGDTNSYYPSIRVEGVNGGVSLGTYYGGNISGKNSLTFLTGNSETDGGSPRLQIRSDNDIEIRNLQSAAGGVDTNALYWKIQNSGNTGQYARLGGIKAETVSAWGGKLKFYTKPANGTPNDTVTEQMVIDQAGRVTTPNQPFFSAAWNHSGTGFVTSYNNIMLNNGGFTITSGKIYVPVAGYYFINAYGIALDEFDNRVVANTQGTSPFLFDFRQSDWSSGTHHGCGNGRVVYLASGSYVGIHRLSGTMYTGAGTNNPHNLISIMLMG
jgi:hypothetical protein